MSTVTFNLVKCYLKCLPSSLPSECFGCNLTFFFQNLKNGKKGQGLVSPTWPTVLSYMALTLRVFLLLFVTFLDGWGRTYMSNFIPAICPSPEIHNFQAVIR